jgi:hypothetical protein
VSDTDRVTAALAAHTTALAATVRNLDALFRAAPGALSALDRALPTVAPFAADLQPALRAAPRPLLATDALLGQVAQLVRAPELPGFVNALAPVTAELPGFEQRLDALFPLVTPVSRCVSTHVIPVLNEKLSDGSQSTGAPAWLDLLHAGTGLSGVSSDFDANGVALRAGGTAGDQTLTASVPALGSLVGAVSDGVEGVDPQWLGPAVLPPMRPDQSCLAQALPDLGARRVSGSAGTTLTPTPAGASPSTDQLQTLVRKVLATQARSRSGR